MISVNSRLALAIRRLNAEYAKLPDPDSVEVFTDDFIRLEGAIDLALAAGDDPAAFAAIQRWESECLRIFTEATDG